MAILDVQALIADEPTGFEESWMPAEVWVEGNDRLRWNWEDAQGRWRPSKKISSTLNLLGKFTALADADVQNIAEFAYRYGVLEICEHGLPRGHNSGLRVGSPYGKRRIADNDLRTIIGSVLKISPKKEAQRLRNILLSLDSSDFFVPCRYLETDDGGWEPIDAWRQFSRRAAATIRISSMLRRGELGSIEDWRDIRQPVSMPESIKERTKKGVLDGWSLISNEIDMWLLLGNARLVCSNTGEGCAFDLYAHGLFGDLAIRLARAVIGKRVAACSVCGRLYKPKKQPREGEKNYCGRCTSDGFDIKNAKKRHEERRRLARETIQQGERSPEIICERIGGDSRSLPWIRRLLKELGGNHAKKR